MPQVTSPWTAMADRVGIVASAACFVHCIATPVILSFSAVYAHFLPSEEHTHRLLAVFVALVGAIALGMGFRKHKQKSILWLMAIGLALIFAGAYFGDHLPSHWMEVTITLLGSCCMITAHRRNHTFCGDCKRCPNAGG